MTHPSPPVIDYVREKVAAMAGGWTLADSAIHAAIEAIKVANPVATAPQSPVVGTWSWREARKRISDASLARLQASGVQGEMLASLNADASPANLAYWLGYLTDSGPDQASEARPVITAAEAAAVMAHIVDATAPKSVADPSWTATITEFQFLFSREPLLDDVAASRPTGG